MRIFSSAEYCLRVARRMSLIASAYLMGLYGAPDPEAGLKWYSAAEVHENPSAQHHLGYMYAMAEGVEQDLNPICG